MLPPIHYAPTEGGGALACWSLGTGYPLVIMSSPPFSHLEKEWQQPDFRRWYERLAEHFQVIRYDSIGTGLSSPPPADVTIELISRDIDAVADYFRLDAFHLFSQLVVTPAALEYVSREPSRVSHLILGHPTVGIYDRDRSPRLAALLNLLDTDWDLFIETVSHVRRGWDAHRSARELAELMSASVSREYLQRLVSAFERFDVRPLLPLIRTPTLLLYAAERHPDDDRMRVLEAPTDLASAISGSVLSIVPGDAAPPYSGDAQAVISAVEQFLGVGTADTQSTPRFDERLGSVMQLLSPREREVLDQMALGRSNEEIAEAMVIGITTVKSHASSIYRKLGVRGRTQAIRLLHPTS